MTALPGDIIVYPADAQSKSFASRAVVAGEIMAGLGNGLRQYSHAAVVARYDGWQHEAKFPFTGYFPIDKSRPYEVWQLADLTDSERSRILSWCWDHDGDAYNLIGVLTFGRINLPGTYYCSQYACLAYASVGRHPGDRIMSPDSITQYPGMKMVYRYDP